MLRYIISSAVLAATHLHKSERKASFLVKPVVHQGFNIRCASQNSFFSHQPRNLHPRTRVSFPVTFLSSASRTLTSVSSRTRLLRTAVEDWKTSHLVDWLRKNTDLPLEDIQLVERSNLSGIDVMNLLISSFDKLRERYPGASFKLWRAFLQIRLATCMPTSLSTEAPTAGEYQLKLPFVGRQAAITSALPHVRGHVASARTRSSSPLSRGGNERLFAIGAPGIGKTRFGYEFPRLLKEHDPTLKAKLEKVRTVRITFQSDMAINPKVDKKWRTETEQVNWILTSRAIFTTYDVGTTYKEWATTLAGLIGDVLPPDFNMETFTKELIAIDKPTAIYYHMDEVQAVLNEPAIGGDLICQLSFLYASENKEDMLTLLLYTGTTLSGIKELVRTVKVGKSADFPIISLPLECLSESEVWEILARLKKINKLPWLKEGWEENRALHKLLAYIGGVPRILEELLVLQEQPLENLDDVANNLMWKIQGRYEFGSKLLLACWVALSGKPLRSDLSDDPMGNFKADPPKSSFQIMAEDLQANGYLFLNGETIDTPLLYLRLALMHSWRQFMQQYDAGFDHFLFSLWRELMALTGALTWSDFEGFSLIHTILRNNALITLHESSMKLEEYFQYAQVSLNLKGLEIKISSQQFIKLAKQWPKDSIPTFVTTVQASKLTSSVFLNATGAICDGFEFVEVVSEGKPQFLLFAHQNKYTEGGKTPLHTKTVVAEKEKVHAAFEDWKKRISQIPEYAHFQNSKAILVIYTNRKIKASRGIHLPTEDLIIVDNNQHFGPLRTLIEFFSQTSKKSSGSKSISSSLVEK